MAVLTKNWAQVSAVPAVRVEGAGNKAASLSLRLSSVYPSRRDEQMKCTCDMLGTQVGVPASERCLPVPHVPAECRELAGARQDCNGSIELMQQVCVLLVTYLGFVLRRRPDHTQLIFLPSGPPQPCAAGPGVCVCSCPELCGPV